MSARVLGARDQAAVALQLGRPARDVITVAHRCRCGLPDVVETAPRLSDRTPFPTLYYLTCPRAVSAIGTLEASGLMTRLNERLMADHVLRAAYERAHRAYLSDRSRHADVPEIAQVSVGGMPDRVKCLHALVAHSLAAGPGVNPIGDEVMRTLPEWWRDGACVDEPVVERR